MEKSESPLELDSIIHYFSGRIISAILSFTLLPLITRLINPEQLGKASMYNLVLSFISMIVFLGLDQSVLREGKFKKSTSNLILTAFVAVVLISSILICLIVLFWKSFSLVVIGDTNFLFILLIVLTIPFLIISRFSQIILRLKNRSKKYSFAFIIKKAAYLGFFSLLVFFSKNYLVIVIATFLSWCSESVYFLLVTKKEWERPKHVNYQKLKPMLKFGFPMMLSAIIYYIFETTDRLSIRYFSDFSELGIYSAGFRISAILLLFRSAFTTFWIPKSYQLFDSNRNTNYFNRLANLIFAFFGFLILLMLIFKEIIILILGIEYRSAVILLPWLFLIPLSHVLSDVLGIGITGNKKTTWNIFIVSITAIINLAGNILLVPKFGALGAAISSGLSFLIFLWLKILISKFLGIKIKLNKLIVNTLLFVFSSLVNIIVNSLIYQKLVLVIILSVFLLINKNEIKKVIKRLYNFIKQKFSNKGVD